MRVRGLLPFCLAIALASPAAGAVQYYVDPVNGTDSPAGGDQGAPWRTVAYAVGRILLLPPASQAGLVLNLRANALYPPVALPATLRGTSEQPIVIQPYDGDRVVFDGGEARFRQPGAWEPVPGQVDEWRTKETFQTAPRENVSVGQMMDTRFRLIKYAAIEDMRAANESFDRVPLSDPRPAFGPLVGDPTRKIPFTYLGPGLTYVFENAEKTIGRTHIRLSPTHIRAPGIEDYAGGGDPNTMALSIARNNTVTGTIQAQNLVLRRLVFQNGGETTLRVGQNARNLTFDHCEVWGGRYGMMTSALASELRFHDCTFDGGLAPWTSRSDVKNEYFYIGPPGCPTEDGKCINNMGTKTHDILVGHGASRSEYVRCTFRRAHDGIQVGGDDVEIRDSLFEDLNDEVVQLARRGTREEPILTHANLRIHGNVFRQVLHPLSFALAPRGGPVYFYRNVIDQRVPTRGYRVLPPDAPAPWIWRYGADFKDAPTLPFHCYQNTFLASHDLDKASYLSHLFYSDPPVGPTFLNNVYVAMNVDRPLSRVPSPSVGALANGNVWYRFEGFPDPLSPRPLWVNGPEKYLTLEELHAAAPWWEAQSQYADPQLANFTDEHFEYASFHPNTDYRPLPGGPADLGGVALPSGLPDDFPSAAVHAGARPAGAPVMTVGVDAATPFPVSGVPVALAGADQTVVDADGDGFEAVTLQGSGSFDPDGAIDAYAWSTLNQPWADSATALVVLPEGDHYARLVVTDNEGKVDSDAVRVRVVPAVPGENRLSCPGFEEGMCGWELAGGGARTKGGHSGRFALQFTQNGAVQVARQRVPVSLGSYTVSGWFATGGLSTPAASLVYSVLDADGAVLLTRAFARKAGTSPYTYHEAAIGPVKGAAFIEVAAALGGPGLGRAFFDDLRIRDRNLLENGRFEVRAVNGQEDEAPGWVFVRPGQVVHDPASVRSGERALALTHGGIITPTTDALAVNQEIAHVSPSGYRVSLWVKTSGLSLPPTFEITLHGPSGRTLGTRTITIAAADSDYTYLSRTLDAADIPAETASLMVTMGLPRLAEGTAFFDDVMVEPLPSPSM
jgi:hypothetical protein